MNTEIPALVPSVSAASLAGRRGAGGRGHQDAAAETAIMITTGRVTDIESSSSLPLPQCSSDSLNIRGSPRRRARARPRDTRHAVPVIQAASLSLRLFYESGIRRGFYPSLGPARCPPSRPGCGPGGTVSGHWHPVTVAACGAGHAGGEIIKVFKLSLLPAGDKGNHCVIRLDLPLTRSPGLPH